LLGQRRLQVGGELVDVGEHVAVAGEAEEGAAVVGEDADRERMFWGEGARTGRSLPGADRGGRRGLADRARSRQPG
jgi:hypothetical protein